MSSCGAFTKTDTATASGASGHRPAPIWLGVVACLALVATACGGTARGGERATTAAAAPACAEVADIVELGRPGRSGPPAQFTTSGAELFVTASGFLHGGPLDPEVGITMVSVGPADEPPTWDPQRNTITNVQEQAQVREGQVTPLRLQAGRYWLWTSNTVTITLQSCQVATFTSVQPVP